MMMSALRSKAHKTLAQLLAEADAANARRTEGIARAWANHRAAHPPAQLWALHDDWPHLTSISTFGSLEDALADRAGEGHTTAVVRPCAIAWPTGGDLGRLADHVIEEFNGEDHSEWVSDWSDYARQDTDVCELPDTRSPIFRKVNNEARRDLARMLADTIRAWALRHGAAKFTGGTVSWGAWKYTGPVRRFEIWSRAEPIEGPFNAVAAAGHDWWIELCPLTIAHGAHNCTLPLGHAGDCEPEFR